MSAVHNGKIYLFGGGTGKRWLGMPDAWVYDPTTDKWSDLSDMPIQRLNGAAVTAGDYIYIFGGHKGELIGRRSREEEIVTTYKYDPSSDTYTRVADMPETGCFIVSAYYKGYIYAIPGCEHELFKLEGGDKSEYVWGEGVLRYDPANDFWIKLNTPRIQQRTWCLTQLSTHAAIGSKLYIFGGCPPSRVQTDLATYYDMENDSFSRIEPLSYTRCCGASGVVNGKIYVMGGFVKGTSNKCKETWGYPFPGN